MFSKITRLAITGAAIATMAFAASPVAAANDAMVRVLHASPDAPAVDVYVNGAKVGAPLANLKFGDLSAYVALPAGTYDLKVCAAADATICPIVANGVALTAGTHYTIAATNKLATIEAQIITDAPAPVADKTQVRVVHFSSDTPAVDVLTQDGAAKVVENLAYPNATGYLTLDAGSYDLKVCANADNTVCPLDPGALDLAAGTSYSVFAIGSLTATPATLTAVVGVDAVAAPATDTIESPAAVVTTSPVSVLLIGAALVSLLGAARLATRRVER
ncbi:MAG: DUF4397 domain-containing protein [Chloroflexota bacterium]